MTRMTLAAEGRDLTPAEINLLDWDREKYSPSFDMTPGEVVAAAREAAETAHLDADEIEELERRNSWDAVLSDRLAPASMKDEPVAELIDEEDDSKLFAATIVDEIDETFSPEESARVEEMLAKFAAEEGAVEEASVSAEVTVRPPLTAAETTRRDDETTRKVNELAHVAGHALDPAWGLQRPFTIDDEIVAKLVTMGDTYLSALERIQLLLRDRVAFRDSGEAMIWTDGRVWLDNPRFEPELHKLLNMVIRAIKIIEMPARLESVKFSGDYKLAEKDLERAKLSGEVKKIREAEKDLKDLERAVLGGVEKMWRKLEDMSPSRLVADAIAHLRAECHVPDALWLSGGRKLNFRDWTVDVFSGEKWEHRRDDYLHHMIDLDYDAVVGARNDDVEAIFSRVPEDNQPGARNLLRRYFGSMLTGSVNHKTFLYLWGENNSGKSTIVKAAESAIATNPAYGRGANLIHSAGPEAFQRMSGDASKSLARHQLRGRRGVWVDEAQGVNYDADFLNRMTNPAGDIESQPLFAKKGERVLWVPEATITLVGNRAGGIPMQEGVQRRMLVVKSGARFSDGDHDVTAAAGAEKADVGIISRLKTEEARAAMLWQMILGLRDLGEVGDRGDMEGECAGWLNEGRESNSEDSVDARAIWLRDFVEVIDEAAVADYPDTWFYSLQEAFAEVTALNAGYLRANNAFDRVTDKSLSEFLSTKGFKKTQVRRDGKRVYGFPRLRRRAIDSIPTELQEYSIYAGEMSGEYLGRSRSGGLVTKPKSIDALSSMPREELEAMIAEMLGGGSK